MVYLSERNNYRILYVVMKIKQTVIITAVIVSVSLLITPVVFAKNTCGSGKGAYETSVIPCDKNGNAIGSLLLLIINILTGAVGIAAVGGVTYGAILYATAEGDVGKVHKARILIANVVLGLIMWALAYSFLNYIIPGGVFS